MEPGEDWAGYTKSGSFIYQSLGPNGVIGFGNIQEYGHGRSLLAEVFVKSDVFLDEDCHASTRFVGTIFFEDVVGLEQNIKLGFPVRITEENNIWAN